MTPIERAALALKEQLAIEGLAFTDPEWADVARAVVAAIREPSEAMLHEGWKQSPQIGCAFTAMIDALLEEGK